MTTHSTIQIRSGVNSRSNKAMRYGNKTHEFWRKKQQWGATHCYTSIQKGEIEKPSPFSTFVENRAYFKGGVEVKPRNRFYSREELQQLLDQGVEDVEMLMTYGQLNRYAILNGKILLLKEMTKEQKEELLLQS